MRANGWLFRQLLRRRLLGLRVGPGDYACKDLFDTNLEREEFDADSPPGDDEWPFVMTHMETAERARPIC